jgi:hypothetical protein
MAGCSTLFVKPISCHPKEMQVVIEKVCQQRSLAGAGSAILSHLSKQGAVHRNEAGS